MSTATDRVDAARANLKRVEHIFYDYHRATRAELEVARAEYRDALIVMRAEKEQQP